jgi:hypothetical protein
VTVELPCQSIPLSILICAEWLDIGIDRGPLALFAAARPAHHGWRGEPDYVLLIQQRSEQVVNAEHTFAVIPKAFHQPMVEPAMETPLLRTLKREIEEELLNRTDLDQTSPDWVRRSTPCMRRNHAMTHSHSPYVGNAAQDGAKTRGWLVGHFLGPEGGIRTSSDVEVKWGVHPAGERREGMVTADVRTTVLMLVSGRFEIELDGTSHMLQESGDYVMWGPGVDHIWDAHEDTVIITVRWPSVATD